MTFFDSGKKGKDQRKQENFGHLIKTLRQHKHGGKKKKPEIDVITSTLSSAVLCFSPSKLSSI